MVLEEVVGEIKDRGANHLVSSWETRCEEQGPPIVRDSVAGTREMTKDYFCRNTLRDLREKTLGFPIPFQKPSGPEPSNSPAPINPTQKTNPFYLHPKTKVQPKPATATSTSANSQNVVEPVASNEGNIVSFKVVVGENNPSKKPAVVRRKYEEIRNWEDGRPDCPAKPTTYEAFRVHRSRCGRPGQKVTCLECGKQVAKSNTTHLKNCPNKK